MISSLSSLASDYFINQSSGGTQLTGIALLLSQANVWCDASDATTIFNNTTQLTNTGTNSFLNKWVNKNNTSRSFTSTSSFRWNNTFNTSYRGIQNVNSNTWLSYSDPATLPFSSYSIFILCSNSSDNANSFCGIGSATTNGNNAQLTLAYGANLYVLNGSSVAVQEYASGFNSSPYTSTAITTKPFIFEYIKTQGTNEGYYTGTSMTFTVNNSVSTGSTQQSFLSLFCHNNNGSQALPANSYIAEVLIYPTALNTTDRQMVEGYLAGKYNLRSFLPTNHPYKSSSPA